jgi:hypothetical protein
MIEYPTLGGHGRYLGHNLRHGFRGSVEGMCLLIPFTNKLLKLYAQMVCRDEIDDTQSLALQDTEPWFNLIHPRTMHRREMADKARMLGEPSGDLFSMMRTDVITHAMNRPNVLGNLLVHMFEKGEEFLLPFAFITLAIDAAGPGIEGRKEVEAPARLYSCSYWLGRFCGWAGRVGASRGRGCREVFSSRESTISSGRSGRV